MYPAVACAACKHQRKRCDANCQLAQYFPASKIEDFKNVYRLFGVNNTLKILNSVENHERDKTVETLILEAKMRREYPVLGIVQVERDLRAEIEACQKELDEVNKKLNFFRQMTNLEKQKEDGDDLELDGELLDKTLMDLSSRSPSLLQQDVGNTSMLQPLGDACHYKGNNYWGTTDGTVEDEML